MCFVWLSEETVPFALYIIKRMVFLTEAESVYSAVRTESLYKTDMLRPLKMYVWNLKQKISHVLWNYVCSEIH
jgi:hypothetical protein